MTLKEALHAINGLTLQKVIALESRSTDATFCLACRWRREEPEALAEIMELAGLVPLAFLSSTKAPAMWGKVMNQFASLLQQDWITIDEMVLKTGKGRKDVHSIMSQLPNRRRLSIEKRRLPGRSCAEYRAVPV